MAFHFGFSFTVSMLSFLSRGRWRGRREGRTILLLRLLPGASDVGVRTSDGVLPQALGCPSDLAASVQWENLLPALWTRNVQPHGSCLHQCSEGILPTPAPPCRSSAIQRASTEQLLSLHYLCMPMPLVSD